MGMNYYISLGEMKKASVALGQSVKNDFGIVFDLCEDQFGWFELKYSHLCEKHLAISLQDVMIHVMGF